VAYVQQALNHEVPRTKLKFGERAFSLAGPAAWNALIPAAGWLKTSADIRLNRISA